MQSKTTFAARAGRWSAHHAKTALGLWVVFVVASVMIGQGVGMVNTDDNDGSGDSGRADRVLQQAFPKKDAEETVLIQGPKGSTVSSAKLRAAVRDVASTLRAQPGVEQVRSPLSADGGDLISADRRSALVTFSVPGDDDATQKAIVPIERAVTTAAERHPGLFIGQFGDASADRALSKSFSDDFRSAETLSLPITLAILFLAFGSLVAAGIPLLLGISAVAATLGLVGIVSHILPMGEEISSVVLLIGLAVGVDYSLFYLRREREERRRGASAAEAVDVAAATSGRAILVSGLTVIAAMAGMLFAGDSTFVSFGIGSMIVVAVAMIGSITAVPAALALLGSKVDRGRLPFIGKRLAAREEGGRFWRAVVDGSLRRPLLSVVLAGGLLVTMAIPALTMRTALSGTSDLPQDLPAMRVYERMQAAFPGGQIPAEVVVRASDLQSPRMRAAISGLERRAIASGAFNGPVDVSVAPGGKVASIQIPMAGDGNDAASMRALERLRGTLIPQTVGRVPGSEVYVTGMAAGTKDFNDVMTGRAPFVFLFVLTLAFVLLLVTFRSIVVPVKAIVLNLLSVGAAYGVLVWIFQRGHLEGVLGFNSNGAVVSWLPMFLFVILFGLSMDYHVFILSRIREAVDRGKSTDEAVREGILATAGTVTSAAFVMVAVFGVFATLSYIEFKQMGVGLAVAILIDATIVRAVLLPATMKLLGERNWYLPRRLQWLPRVSWEGQPSAARSATTVSPSRSSSEQGTWREGGPSASPSASAFPEPVTSSSR